LLNTDYWPCLLRFWFSRSREFAFITSSQMLLDRGPHSKNHCTRKSKATWFKLF
jgi:hypothetical protein